MAYETFLHRLAVEILDKFHEPQNAIVVLPNRRARIFLLDEMRKVANRTFFAPDIISIEEFIGAMADIRPIDNIALLFEFYDVYRAVTHDDPIQEFDQFANWAKMLLQDFNEIDRYLLDPAHVLSYLKNIEDIKHWSLDPEKKTPLIEKHLKFWDILPNYYDAFYDHLKNKGIGYQGLIYREAVAKMQSFVVAEGKTYVFAGFNAMNAAEEKIIQHLLEKEQALVFWDIDNVFLENRQHDAGLFIRQIRSQWKHYRSNEFKWIADSFSAEKNISIIGTPKSIGQAKIAGSSIAELMRNGDTPLNKVAVVLGDENLLIPLLHSLPEGLPGLNITMGYPAKNNPVQVLIGKIFKLHTGAISRNARNYLMYYKDVLDILTHPLIEPYANASDAVLTIKRNNFTFITLDRLTDLLQNASPLCKMLFEKWDSGAGHALQSLSDILVEIKGMLGKDDQDKITKAFVFAIFKVINQIRSYYELHPQVHDISSLYSMYKQVADLAEVSFEGQPLEGLQVMGVLESRVLDFETVIVTSVNEGSFPAGKGQNSFIPYDVKRELGLPTFKEKDAIYTYHFYHLLMRAKNIILLYNTESEGLDGGEKSRFITQLEVERQPNHIITEEIYNPKIPPVVKEPIRIGKSDAVMNRLAEIAKEGFSPSALTSYIRNPIEFYMRKILRVRESDEVEENIAVNTLGTIIHESLRELYEPLVERLLTEDDIRSCIGKIDESVLRQFKIVYREGDIRKGRNLLAFEVAKRHVLNFLKSELKSIQDGDQVRILYLEQRFERFIEHPSLPFPVKIGGTVDRIEDRNGIIRIIDYKSGKVEARNLCLEEWEGLVSDSKFDKIIQVLAYAFMLGETISDKKAEAGIISFKNMKSGFLPFEIKKPVRTSLLSKELLDQYIGQIVILLQEIFDKEKPFEEKV